MDILTAKENLFKMKPLKYLEALETKIELIRNSKKIDLNISPKDIHVIKLNGNYYLKFSFEDKDNVKIFKGEEDY